MALGTILGLAKFLPEVIGLFGSKGKKAKKALDTVGEIALSMSGKNSIDDAAKAFDADPDLAYKFRMAVMDNETVMERLDEESRERASEQYKVHHAAADEIAKKIMTQNLIIVFVLVIVNTLAVYYLKDLGALLAVVSNLIGVVIGQLLNERHQVTSFHFGSSLGSKTKDALKKPES